ncbi:hypothetical protein QJQ45_028276, partial [Haematococcus lacustris]
MGHGQQGKVLSSPV